MSGNISNIKRKYDKEKKQYALFFDVYNKHMVNASKHLS